VAEMFNKGCVRFGKVWLGPCVVVGHSQEKTNLSACYEITLREVFVCIHFSNILG